MIVPKCLVFTYKGERRVGITHPLPDALRWMSAGGFYNGAPRGFLDELVRRKTDAKLQQGHPCSEDAAWRMVKAWAFGGCTTAEAYDIIKDHDCARFGRLIELHDDTDLPDRWFRDAWYRSDNGGPVGVDLDLARPIQWTRIWTAVEEENKARTRAYIPKPMLTLPGEHERTAIRHARDENELRRIWPEGLPDLTATPSPPGPNHTPNLTTG